MRQYLLLFALMLPVGCATGSAPSPPPAPGYIDAADQQMSEILHAANALYDRLYADGTKIPPTYTPGPAEKAAFNSFGEAVTTANHIYKAFHAGQATEQQAQAAVNTAQTQQSVLQAFPGAK